jgi:hypothetical protein
MPCAADSFAAPRSDEVRGTACSTARSVSPVVMSSIALSAPPVR